MSDVFRAATPADIVRRLTGTPYASTAESALAGGMGLAQRGIGVAVDEAIASGSVRVTAIRSTTYARSVRFLTLAVGHCDTCVRGCHCEGGGVDSCGHLGCWGPAATSDCAGILSARARFGL